MTTDFSPQSLQDFSSDFTMDFSELNYLQGDFLSGDLNGLRIDFESLDHEVGLLNGTGGWRSTLPQTSSGEELPLDRPRKLLREPELVEKEGDFLIQPRTGKVWRILRWDESDPNASFIGGGARADESKWSRKSSSKKGGRDYYRVTAIEQNRGRTRRRLKERELWIFSSHHQPGFYLFGYFD